MFTEIYKLIDERKYYDAVTALLPLYKDGNTETAARAGYLLGYIHTRYDYEQKNAGQAKRYLRENIYGDHPQPYAFVLYSRIEDDHNIALNHLERGLKRFPKDVRILEELLAKSPDKDAIVAVIKDSGLNNPDLMGSVISYLVKENQWDGISVFLFRKQSTGDVEENDQLYLDLIRGYVHIFQKNPDYKKAQETLEKVISRDIDNQLAYAHYLGLIYSLIKQGEIIKARGYFDRLPVNNSIMDLDERPYPFCLWIDFVAEYKIIFDCLVSTFAQDSERKQKARVLYALYLYHPSECFDICRYQKTDATVLARYIKTEFNPKVAAALYNMRCHFKQYKEAYEVLWQFLKAYENLEDNWVFFSEIINSADEACIQMLVEQTVIHLQEDDYDQNLFVDEIFADLIKELHEFKMYSDIRKVAEFVSDEEIIRSGCTFSCAYAFGDVSDDRATALYEKLVEREPDNSAAINNLGVRYREQGALYKALLCYEKANKLAPQEELYKDNLKKVKNGIREQMQEEIERVSENISLEALRGIGYTIDLCKRIYSIDDVELREIIQRDLRECAIAVVAEQDKLATIMCGSIAEALLLHQVNKKGVTKYDVSAVSRRRDAPACPVSEMVLNELLYVALKENILDKSEHNLGHYLKDYRNMIHPAREIRAKENVTHENVGTMWSVLVRLISALFLD